MVVPPAAHSREQIRQHSGLDCARATQPWHAAKTTHHACQRLPVPYNIVRTRPRQQQRAGKGGGGVLRRATSEFDGTRVDEEAPEVASWGGGGGLRPGRQSREHVAAAAALISNSRRSSRSGTLCTVWQPVADGSGSACVPRASATDCTAWRRRLSAAAAADVSVFLVRHAGSTGSAQLSDTVLPPLPVHTLPQAHPGGGLPIVRVAQHNLSCAAFLTPLTHVQRTILRASAATLPSHSCAGLWRCCDSSAACGATSRCWAATPTARMPKRWGGAR